MGGTMSGNAVEVTRTRRARARSRARWATASTPSRVLARHYGVSASRARHLRSGIEGSAFATVLGMIADPEVDAGPMIVALLESWEERFLYQPTADLRARLKRLREDIEHRAECEQNTALLTRRGAADACRHHASILLELAAHEEILNGEEIH